ncbi:pca operon transcription factor PcaQ [Rhodobacteraceae bacterium F11138]|nr:pca operon transcription factor PcaQ [Rhodobacteraceae bacterium F11138]
MDRRIKFRHLEAFSTIARAGSLKRAAERLHLTQPAISRTLKELEDITGARLMERSRSGAGLTPEGEVFLQFAEQCMDALRNGLRSVRAGAGAAGLLRLGVLPSVATGLLPRAARHFADANPDVLLEIHEGPHKDLTGRLRSGTLDLVIGRLGAPETMDGLSFRQLYSEDVVVVCRAGSPAAGITRFADLEAMRVLYPPKNSAIRSMVARLLIAQSVPLFSNRIESASSSFGHAMVLSDPQTVWFISRGVVAADLADGRLVSLDMDTGATIGAVGIMMRAEDIPSASARAFTKVLSAQANRGTTRPQPQA